jgi:integrase
MVRTPWNKGKLVGQKAPLKLKDIWAIRLQIGCRTRELALFNLAIDSKLRSCDLVTLRVRDVWHGSVVAKRAIVIQQKTQQPVQFEITEQTRESLMAWIRGAIRWRFDQLYRKTHIWFGTVLRGPVMDTAFRRGGCIL